MVPSIEAGLQTLSICLISLYAYNVQGHIWCDFIDTMDWKMCVICQKKSGEALKCPLNMPGSETHSQTYQSFMDNVGTFRQLPVSLKFGDNVTANELNEHRAVWHRSCHVKFRSQKVQRAIIKR